jgi:fused signal recognition particle receptor
MLGWFKKKFGKKPVEEAFVEPEHPLEEAPVAKPALPEAEDAETGAEGTTGAVEEVLEPATEPVAFPDVEEAAEPSVVETEADDAAVLPVAAPAAEVSDTGNEEAGESSTAVLATGDSEDIVAPVAIDEAPAVDIAEELAAFFPELAEEPPAEVEGGPSEAAGALHDATLASEGVDEAGESQFEAVAELAETMPAKGGDEPVAAAQPPEVIAGETDALPAEAQAEPTVVQLPEEAVEADEALRSEEPSLVVEHDGQAVAPEALILESPSEPEPEIELDSVESEAVAPAPVAPVPEEVGESGVDEAAAGAVQKAEADQERGAEEEAVVDRVLDDEEPGAATIIAEDEAGREILPAVPLAEKTQEKPASKSLFKRLRDRLGKTRDAFVYRLDRLFLGKKEIDQELFEQLEEILITADLGVKTTLELLDRARKKVKRDQLSDPQALKSIIRDEILAYIQATDQPAELVMPEQGPFVIMVVGVNGVGKTTSIGKIAAKFVRSGQSVLLVAGDTFRAAAINQLRIWGERVGVEVIAQNPGADPSSVVFDGLEYGVAHAYDVILIDTAGRLHTSVNLMEELKKIKRVIGKKMPGAPHEVMLVLDATTGQNGIAQAKQFHEAVGVSGLTLTKLDGTAKGGIVANVCREVGIPVRFIGIGEQIDDLRDFDAREFVDALFAGPEQ